MMHDRDPLSSEKTRFPTGVTPADRALIAAAKAVRAVAATLPSDVRERVRCVRTWKPESRAFATAWFVDNRPIGLPELERLGAGESPALVVRRRQQRLAMMAHADDMARARAQEEAEYRAAAARIKETQARLARNHSTPRSF